MGMSLDYNKFPHHLGMGTVDIHNLKKVKFHSLTECFCSCPDYVVLNWIFVNHELKKCVRRMI